MKFLIVDDSRAIRTIVRRALVGAGSGDCELQAATNGMEALRILDGGSVDMVIAKWHMPGMSGLELLRKLRTQHAPSLKVGFVTTESAQANIDEARQLGALFVLGKPFTDDELARRRQESIGRPAPASNEAAPSSCAQDPRVTVPRLFTSSDARNLRLARTQLLKRQIPQLREIMKRSPCRNDFTIARGDLPVGQLTLMSK